MMLLLANVAFLYWGFENAEFHESASNTYPHHRHRFDSSVRFAEETFRTIHDPIEGSFKRYRHH